MPTKDFDPTQLQHWTAENDGSAIQANISEPEYEEIHELTFRQKLALEWIIFKAWVKRVLNL